MIYIICEVVLKIKIGLLLKNNHKVGNYSSYIEVILFCEKIYLKLSC